MIEKTLEIMRKINFIICGVALTIILIEVVKGNEPWQPQDQLQFENESLFYKKNKIMKDSVYSVKPADSYSFSEKASFFYLSKKPSSHFSRI